LIIGFLGFDLARSKLLAKKTTKAIYLKRQARAMKQLKNAAINHLRRVVSITAPKSIS